MRSEILEEDPLPGMKGTGNGRGIKFPLMAVGSSARTDPKA
jgi:hypothetical protein